MLKMKVVCEVAVLCVVVLAVEAYRYGWPSNYGSYRPPRPSRPTRPTRPQYNDVINVIQAISQLNVSDVSGYYCTFLGGRPIARYYGYNRRPKSTAWQTLTSYSPDKVKSCINLYASNAFGMLSADGRIRFCELVSSLSSSLSQQCEGGVIDLLADLCSNNNNPTTSPPIPTLPPTIPPFPTLPPTIPPVPPSDRACGTSLLGTRDRQVIDGLLTQLRIVGGTNSEYGKFPFIVTVSAAGILCGGTILDTNRVMTAAHCVDNTTPGNVIVGVGEFDRNSNNDQTNFGVRSITIHPQYDGSNINDIAILELSREINYAETNSGPVCLPAPNESAKLDGGQECVVAGWGLLSFGGILPSVLQEVTLPAYDGSRCTGVFNFRPTDAATQLCAGLPQGGIDSCQGDSGGPLMCLEGGRWVQYGIVSYGLGCASAGQPGFYTDVSQYVSNFI